MKFAFDIGGCASKYPREFKELALKMAGCIENVFIITDMHEKDKVLEMLEDNGFSFILKENVYCADYAKYGNFCKAVLLKELGIDMFIDDFEAYLQWDSRLGPAPIRLLIMPDNFKPYWANEWKVRENFDFGRKVVSSPDALENCNNEKSKEKIVNKIKTLLEDAGVDKKFLMGGPEEKTIRVVLKKQEDNSWKITNILDIGEENKDGHKI